MKKKLRILQIRGFKGLFITLFIMSCLIAGFIAFPGFVTMNIWNYFSFKMTSIPSISFYGGTLLWSIMIVSYLILKKKSFGISLGAPKELTETEVKDVISRLKSQKDSPSAAVSKLVDEIKDETDKELTSLQSNSKED